MNLRNLPRHVAVVKRVSQRVTTDLLPLAAILPFQGSDMNAASVVSTAYNKVLFNSIPAHFGTVQRTATIAAASLPMYMALFPDLPGCAFVCCVNSASVTNLKYKWLERWECTRGKETSAMRVLLSIAGHVEFSLLVATYHAMRC